MTTSLICIGELPSDETLFSLGEICERCGMHAGIVIEMVEFGIVAPLGEQASSERWQFSTDALLRLRRAQRLLGDLELNLPGLALALELLDEIDALQQQLASLRQQLGELHGS